MKTIQSGAGDAELSLGGETVLFRLKNIRKQNKICNVSLHMHG